MKIFFSILFSLSPTLALADDPAQVERPNPKIGMRWQVQTLDGFTKVKQSERTLVVASADDKVIRITDAEGAEAIVLDAATFAVRDAGDRHFDPPLERMQFPLVVGKSWKQAYTYNNSQCGKTQSELKFEVARWEDITVPAGKLRALRIDSEGNWRNSCGRDRQSHKYWYVPDLGLIAKQESQIWVGGRSYSFELQELMSRQMP